MGVGGAETEIDTEKAAESGKRDKDTDKDSGRDRDGDGESMARGVV